MLWRFATLVSDNWFYATHLILVWPTHSDNKSFWFIIIFLVLSCPCPGRNSSFVRKLWDQKPPSRSVLPSIMIVDATSFGETHLVQCDPEAEPPGGKWNTWCWFELLLECPTWRWGNLLPKLRHAVAMRRYNTMSCVHRKIGKNMHFRPT